MGARDQRTTALCDTATGGLRHNACAWALYMRLAVDVLKTGDLSKGHNACAWALYMRLNWQYVDSVASGGATMPAHGPCICDLSYSQKWVDLGWCHNACAWALYVRPHSDEEGVPARM